MSAAPRMTSALRVLAFASAAIGLGCAAWAARTAPELLKRMDQRRAELRELADLDVRSKQYDPYWRALAAAGGLPEPEDLFRRGAPDGPAPVVSEGAAEPLDEGWRLRRVEMVIADAPADSLGALIQACGTSRPPWRVSALRVQSLDPGSLRARATIALEGADRGGSGEDATP